MGEGPLFKQKRRAESPPFQSQILTSAAPDVDGEEEEQPNHINEVPVPSSSFKADVLLLREVAAHQAQQADQQEDRADQNVKAVEARRHEEVGTIDVARETKGRVAVFVGLEESEKNTQKNSKDKTPLHIFAVVLVHQCVVRPCRRST